MTDTRAEFEAWIRMTNFDESARERNAATAAWQAATALQAAKIAELEKDLEEQCRINGIGGSREAKLLALIAELEKDLDQCLGREVWAMRHNNE